MSDLHIKNIADLIECYGDDPAREGMIDTPQRHFKAMKNLTSGYQKNLQDIVNDAIFSSDSDEMVTVKNIEMYSLCEHHLLPFFGHCHVSYLPNKKVIGLSKIARIVDMFSKRFQIQERLTSEIANAVQEATNAHGVGVIIEARHFCMMMRGIEKQMSSMSTSSMLGAYKENISTRNEFLQLAFS